MEIIVMELTSLCQYSGEDKQFYEPLKTGINAERYDLQHLRENWYIELCYHNFNKWQSTFAIFYVTEYFIQ